MKKKKQEPQDYKECIYYVYGHFCNKFSNKEYRCNKKCKEFRKDNFINHILRWLCG